MNPYNGSPGRIALRKFWKNPLGFFGVLVVVAISFLAVFAYFIIPDNSPNANRQLLEIATQKPGFSVDFLKVYRKEEGVSFIQKLATGERKNYQLIPVQHFQLKDDSLVLGLFEPDPHVEPIRQSLSVDQFIQDNCALLPESKQLNKRLNEQEFRKYFMEHRVFLLGTDQFGRDLLSRLILGSRISFSVGFIAVFISLCVGITIGSIGVYFVGKIYDVVV